MVIATAMRPTHNRQICIHKPYHIPCSTKGCIYTVFAWNVVLPSSQSELALAKAMWHESFFVAAGGNVIDNFGFLIPLIRKIR
jgi:hypothetical protein